MKKGKDGRVARVLFGGRIPADLHRKAKIYAAVNRIEVQELLEAALERFLATPVHTPPGRRSREEAGNK